LESSDPLPPMPQPEAEANRARGIDNPALPSVRPSTRPVSYPKIHHSVQSSGTGSVIAFPFTQLGNLQP
jgi:hypothetical protein